MTVEIISVAIKDEAITIEGLAIEKVITAEDLYEAYEEVPVVQFEFDRKAHNAAAMKYLWKVCGSQRRCDAAKSMGEKLEKLVGSIIFLSDSFRVA